MGRDKGKFNKCGGRGGNLRFQATSAEDIEQSNSRIARFDEKQAQRRVDVEEEGNRGGEVGSAWKRVEGLNIINH